MRNPAPLNDKRNPEKVNNYSKSYQVKQTKSECVYCKKPDHRSSYCKTAKTVTERRKILRDKKLLINCKKAKLTAVECCRAKTCLICKNKHYTPICDELADSKSASMSATTETNVTYLVSRGGSRDFEKGGGRGGSMSANFRKF